MAQDDIGKNFKKSLIIIREILANLKELQAISPCTYNNCPNVKEIDRLGDCPISCQFSPLKHEKNKLFSFLCGGAALGGRPNNID